MQELIDQLDKIVLNYRNTTDTVHPGLLLDLRRNLTTALSTLASYAASHKLELEQAIAEKENTYYRIRRKHIEKPMSVAKAEALAKEETVDLNTKVHDLDGLYYFVNIRLKSYQKVDDAIQQHISTLNKEFHNKNLF